MPEWWRHASITAASIHRNLLNLTGSEGEEVTLQVTLDAFKLKWRSQTSALAVRLVGARAWLSVEVVHECKTETEGPRYTAVSRQWVSGGSLGALPGRFSRSSGCRSSLYKKHAARRPTRLGTFVAAVDGVGSADGVSRVAFHLPSPMQGNLR